MDTATVPLFTKENARQFQAKAVESRRRNAELREAERLAALQRPPTEPQPESYPQQRLLRVRALLDDVDEQLSKTRDPQDRERLARAANVLSEQERILAGRPLPGSRRPGRDRAPAAAPVEPM